MAEAFVDVRAGPTGTLRDRSYVLLHRTFDTGGEPGPVPGARVVVRRPGGQAVDLPERGDFTLCAPELAVDAPGTCYGPVEGAGVRPGERLELEVELADGGRLASATTVPDSFSLEGPVAGGACRLEPARTVELRWSRSGGSWAYVAETSIAGLSEVLPPAVDVKDPLDLLGVALSSDDTTIVFPSQFGVFDRADLDREVSLLLQEGLPAGTGARVVVAAVDRNYVNWVRGGNFNPSGLVRVPSVRGDGTGFFGSAYSAAVEIVVSADASDPRPPC